MIHQDCLTSWLEVTRGDGRCEICKTKFRFDPQYAENTPDRLAAHEVVLGLSSRFLARWLPLAIRICIAVTLWLVVAPLLTNFLYHGWMIRPSSVLSRWKRELILADIVSGAVMTAIIIISFLSLMSFADFLRAHWQQPPRDDQQQEQVQDQQGNRIHNAGNGANPAATLENAPDAATEDAIDNGVVDFLKAQREIKTTPEVTERDFVVDDGPNDGAVEANDAIRQSSLDAQYAEQPTRTRDADRPNNQPQQGQQGHLHVVDDDIDDDVPDEDMRDEGEDNGLGGFEEGWPEEEEFPGDEVAVDAGNAEDNVAAGGNPRPREGEGQIPRIFDQVDPLLQDDQVVRTSFLRHCIRVSTFSHELINARLFT